MIFHDAWRKNPGSAGNIYKGMGAFPKSGT
jgi:hypothetical protein